ncbi:MAG: tetratricopeptide repeat protein [Rubrivivax sp.]|nr:tetratricopeptide repeat protein [Rubrivivax sp.]
MNPVDNAPLSYDVTEADFRQTVLERSLEVPVLLDCWAPWCAPCRNLKPMLEKLVQEYGGRFELAKLNTDEAPQISAALQIRSIPLVVLFVGGRPVDQFMGAIPESQIRAFLDKHLGEQVDPVTALREDAQAADPQTAEAMLREGLHHVPGDMGLSGDLAERLIARDALDEAEKLLNSVEPTQQDDRHAALLKRIALARNKPAGNAAELEARIAADRKDFDARFALAAIRVYEGDFRAAFDQLLEVVMRDKAEWREKARLQLVEWFDVCGDAEVVSYGRRYLGMYLN